MAGHDFFQYIKLKLFAILLRFLAGRWAINKKDAAAGSHQRELVQIPSRTSGRSIKAWLYSPPNPAVTSSERARPVLINWHGSGFVLPMLGSDAVFCNHVAQETGALVLDVDYRKAPEDPFPGAMHDVEDTLKWVASQPSLFDLKRVSISGFSAGGNLALVAASSLRKDLAPLEIPLVIAVYPVTDISIHPEKKTVPNPIKQIPAPLASFFNDCYTPDVEMRKDPRVSPSYADPTLFPGTVAIITCEGDSLAPEGIKLAEKLDDGQRKVINVNLKGVPHGFNSGTKEGTHYREQQDLLHKISVDAIKEAFGLQDITGDNNI